MKRFLSIILVLAVLCVAAFAIAADDKAPTEAPAVAPAPAPAPAPAAAAPEAAPNLSLTRQAPIPAALPMLWAQARALRRRMI